MNRWNIANAVLFQGTWFACVLGGAWEAPQWGALLLLGMLVLVLMGRHPARDLTLAVIAAAMGFLLDALWIRLGVLDYHGNTFAPLWIVLLWVGVGLTINHSLSFFKSRPWLGGLLAGVAAPLSYLAGERLGAVVVPAPWMLGAISVVWLLLFTLTFSLTRHGAPEYEPAH